MASERVSVDGFSAAVARAFEDAMGAAAGRCSAEVERAARSCAADLRRSSPRDTGDYAGGWRAVTEDSGHERVTVVANRSKPTLTWLLEEGHGLRGGGHVPPDPHIAPAFERAAAELEARLR